MLRTVALFFCAAALCSRAVAEPPGTSYIFPAGGQRGSKVEFRVGGFYFHGGAEIAFEGAGLQAARTVKATDTIWFEGPLLAEPASQQKEDYPKDHIGELTIDADAPLGMCRWHCRTSQGATAAMEFVVGDLPEVVEKEIEGTAIPQSIVLPVTINGRIFPREDVDLWKFRAESGQTIVLEVSARRLGYPWQPALEVSGPGGEAITPARVGASPFVDAALSFTADTAGDYQVAIHDAGFGGAQNFVYRLSATLAPRVLTFYPLGGQRGKTVQIQVAGAGMESRAVPISFASAKGNFLIAPIEIDSRSAGSVALHVDDLPEALEEEPNDTFTSNASAWPAMLNGRIDCAGDADVWAIDLVIGQTVLLDLLAGYLGSKLDAVLTVHDADGKEVARNDDRADGKPDPRLLFAAAKAGRHFLRVSERFASRGGPEFAYRLRVALQQAPDFHLTLNTDALNVVRDVDGDAEAKKKASAKGTALKIDVEPLGAFEKEVALEFSGLPEGVTPTTAVIPAKQKATEIRFTASTATPIQLARVAIRGTAEVDGKKVMREASFPAAFGEAPVGQVRLAVVPAVPFKHVGAYLVTNDQPGGTTASKRFRIERGGFDGPLSVSFADRQLRYLGGVTGPVLTVAKERAEFDYRIIYPVEIEQGHTSRAQLMLTGQMTDFDGSRHTISYTSAEQDDQIIAITTAARLKVSTPETSYSVAAAGSTFVPVTIQRDPLLKEQRVRIELSVPAHLTGVSAAPVDLSAGEEQATLQIDFSGNAGPINAPLTIVARTMSADSSASFGATKVELVGPFTHEIR